MPLLSYCLLALQASWNLLLESSLFILFGLAVGGLLQHLLSPTVVARHLGRGRFLPVVKAALFGIPIPLCSCGVLPAAATLKKQGANNGATVAFLISTPESGIDSISISYALLDPLMTIARPLAAFFSAISAGIAENLLQPTAKSLPAIPMWSAPISGGNGETCGCGTTSASVQQGASGLPTTWLAAARFVVDDLWGDLAGWFFLGLLAAGIITALVPDEMVGHYLGGGVGSMLVMLVVGVPLYICATASTPIAAAMILKGVSPGTALVFLLVGPATNITSLAVLIGILGKRATMLYLVSIALISMACGLLLDALYRALDISARASIGQAAELLPSGLKSAATVVLLLLTLWSARGRFHNAAEKFFKKFC